MATITVVLEFYVLVIWLFASGRNLYKSVLFKHLREPVAIGLLRVPHISIFELTRTGAGVPGRNS